MRAMVELAREYGDGPVLLATVAKRQQLSPKYLHALLSSLKRAGLVQSRRGAGGGYELGRPPACITLLEVLEALEGPVLVTDCLADDAHCDIMGRCSTRGLWFELSETITKLLGSKTLAVLAQEGEE